MVGSGSQELLDSGDRLVPAEIEDQRPIEPESTAIPTEMKTTPIYLSSEIKVAHKAVTPKTRSRY